ncbi:hypothetical protein M2480_001297 [Parabacteroides sp. PFB2-12]|uniref:hypothetical protein n=1 Tax=unclassified Parabacteroides TaxID=2649774 RepID=UPI0024737387|nr:MULTISPECIES: hypothetical protein [unclassified Parabacteroides]MDH6343308.1 hypothetical protein [Parabacteroides sp. PM6-13]MDH6390324.1 hypothetical protein [Parabacteroides sp. PFB2-12]
MNVVFIIFAVIAFIAVVLFFFKLKTKPKTLYDELMEIPGMKEQKELFELMSKMNSEGVGTEEDVMSEGYGDFGLEITNPIPVNTVYGSISYLGRLRTLEGIKVSYKRIGSMNSPNITSIIDGYKIFANEKQIAILYICPYNKKNSRKAPNGFKLLV